MDLYRLVMMQFLDVVQDRKAPMERTKNSLYYTKNAVAENNLALV
jgi:hypothetical protein